MRSIIYSIGHGRHPFPYFLELLQKNDVEFVCDVRAFARSRWPQFNGLVLADLLRENGIGYEHLPECGGKIRPRSEDFDKGIDRIAEIAFDLPTAIMCSESKPLTDHKMPRARCHRVGMVAPELRAKGFDRIIHILPDSSHLEIDESSLEWNW